MDLAGRASILILLFSSLAGAASPEAQVDGKNIRIEFDRLLHSRVIAKFAGKETAIGNFTASEWITVDGKPVKDFVIGKQLKNPLAVLGVINLPAPPDRSGRR